MTLSERIDELMPLVQKPSRYIGNEYNAVMKDASKIDVRYAFLFPDVYEVGMSHLGMKILYHTLNKREDTWCERVFTPWPDMHRLMSERNIPLFSMESRTPVKEFDILGITLMYEMSYTNILLCLKLAGIPLYAKDRTDSPIVICGGTCAYNPEPLAPFVDVFTVGDGENAIHQTVDLMKACKQKGFSKQEYLTRVAQQVEGAYVPSMYDIEYNPDNTVKSVTPKPGTGAKPMVYKALVNDLTAADYPEKLIVPYGEVIHDRIMLEIFRGCTRGCRFCQAGMVYRPVRERSIDRLMEIAEKLVSATGFDEISLMSLSSGDYSCLPELAHEMVERFIKKRVKISLPSQRIDAFLKDTLKETQKVRKTALTLAPEAGTQRLRDVINKGVTEEDLMRAVTDAFSEGWSAVKLYFMIGLPTETDEDILGIADLAAKVRRCYFSVPKDKRSPGFRITVSASVFVPKPDTPFQWCAQLDSETVRHRQLLLKQELDKIKGVDYKYHEMDVSYLEAVFSRGDRRCAEVLKAASDLGCEFDGWSEMFNKDAWQKAFETTGIDPEFYASRTRSLDEVLPWSHIDCGVSIQYLKSEYQKAMKGEITPDCRKGCNGCGLMRYEGACR